MPDAGSYLELTPHRPAAAVHLRFARPMASIDGSDPLPLVWKPNRLALLPGPHQVQVWLDRGDRKRAGEAHVTVVLSPGSVTHVAWRTSGLGGAGAVTVLGDQLALVDTRQPAGWYPDPTGRREERWWDGTDWTPHARQNGVTIHDLL